MLQSSVQLKERLGLPLSGIFISSLHNEIKLETHFNMDFFYPEVKLASLDYKVQIRLLEMATFKLLSDFILREISLYI